MHPAPLPSPSASVRDLLLAQDGVVSVAQALAAGLSRQAVRRRVARGEWVDVHPGVLAEATRVPTATMRIRAAALWAGPRGLVHGPAAASWSRMLDRCPRDVGVTLPRGTRRLAPGGVALRRRDVPGPDRAWIRGVAVTAEHLTVLETCAVLPDGAAFLDRVLQRRVVHPALLHEAYCRNAGAHGMAAAHRLLVAALDRADSELERTLLRLLRSAGMGGVVRGLPVGGGRQIDLAFPAERVAIELDGWAWHTDPDRFRADRAKGNALVAQGWTLLRFTWHDVHDAPEGTLAAIRQALRR